MLAEIPIKLLLMVADCLSRNDVTCISRCNHRLFAVSISGEKDNFKYKPAILNRLQQDLPHYFLCCICNRLHKHDSSEDFGLKVSSALFKRDRSLKGTLRWTKYSSLTLRIQTASPHFKILYKSNFLHLQLAMRRHHYGPEFGISTEAMSFSQVQRHPTQITSTLFSVDAQICSEPASLCLRIQQLMYMKGHQPALLSSLASSRLPIPTWFCENSSSYKLDCTCCDLLVLYSEEKRASSFDHTSPECSTEILIGFTNTKAIWRW